MVRPLRIEYPGAWYHVTCRGNQRIKIFGDDRDRKRFLKALKESIEVFNVEVHCYVLMSNHFHFLLKTPEANLGRFMQRFNTAYITYYNLRHHKSGHKKEGRKRIIPPGEMYGSGVDGIYPPDPSEDPRKQVIKVPTGVDVIITKEGKVEVYPSTRKQIAALKIGKYLPPDFFPLPLIGDDYAGWKGERFLSRHCDWAPPGEIY